MSLLPGEPMPAGVTVQTFAPQLSIVVPVHDEQDNISSLLEEIHVALVGVVDFEVLVIDDASGDETPQRLQQVRNVFPRLRVVRHLRNCGQSAAVATGVGSAKAVARAPVADLAAVEGVSHALAQAIYDHFHESAE